jgi:hypothetical protein
MCIGVSRVARDGCPVRCFCPIDVLPVVLEQIAEVDTCTGMLPVTRDGCPVSHLGPVNVCLAFPQGTTKAEVGLHQRAVFRKRLPEQHGCVNEPSAPKLSILGRLRSHRQTEPVV